MKLESPLLVKSLRKQARSEMRADSALWKDYRRHRSTWWRRAHQLPGYLLSYLYLLVAAAVAGLTFDKRGLLLLGSVLYATGTTLWRGLVFHNDVVGSYDRAVALHLPLSDEAFFAYEWRKCIVSWIKGFCVFLFAYGMLAIGSDRFLQNSGPAVLASALQATIGLTLSLWVLAKAPRFKNGTVSFCLYGLIVISWWLPASTVQSLWSAALLLPGGWVAHAFAAMLGRSPAYELAFLLPALAVAATLPLAFRSARKRLLAELHAQVYEELLQAAQPEDNIEEPAGWTAPLAPEAQLWQGHYLKTLDWTRAGWIEDIVSRLFDVREIAVAEFMLGNQLGAWSKRWRTGVWIAAAGILVTSLSPQKLVPGWILTSIVVIAAFWGMPVLGGFWQAFQGAPTSGFLTAAYAAFPIGYGQITRVMVISNLVRILCFAPIFMGHVVALEVHYGGASIYGAAIAIKLLLMIIVFQPLTIPGHISANSNDTRIMRRPMFLLFLFGLVLLAVTVLAVLVLFDVVHISEREVFAHAVAVVVIAACSLSMWAVYGQLFNRGIFDVLAKPQQ